jgi:pimeloyl-ACP methyl ester carboxylesterase
MGGKVALAFAELSGLAARTWVLDSMPGRVEGDPHGVRSILAAVADLPPLLQSREGLQQALRSRVSPAIAAWLASSLVPATAGGPLTGPLRFNFAFQDALQLFEDYRSTDCWHVVSSPPAGADVHLLCAGKSAAWSDPAVARTLAMLPASRVHVIKEAGHWLHTTHPGEVAALLAEHAMRT